MFDEVTIYRMRVFAVLVELKSMVKTAERLHISQPAVSSHLKSLEDKAGCTLVERKRGARLRVTPSGMRLYQFVRQTLDESEKLERELAALATGERGTLEVGANFTVGNHLLPEPLLRFKQQYPDVRVRLGIEVREAVAQHVLEGRYPLGIVINDVILADIAAEEIFRAEMVVVAPGDHPMAHRVKPVPPTQLQNLPFITGLRESLYHQQLAALLESRGLRLRNIIVELGDEAAQKRAVLAGGGLAVLHRHTVSDELARGLVGEVPVQGFPLFMPVYVIYRKGYRFTPLEARFLEFLHSAIGS